MGIDIHRALERTSVPGQDRIFLTRQAGGFKTAAGALASSAIRAGAPPGC
jgi:hypothetical protein